MFQTGKHKQTRGDMRVCKTSESIPRLIIWHQNDVLDVADGPVAAGEARDVAGEGDVVRDHDAERCWTRCGVHWQQPGLGVPWSASGDTAVRQLPCLGGAPTDGVRCSWLPESRRALLAQEGVGFSIDGI